MCHPAAIQRNSRGVSTDTWIVESDASQLGVMVAQGVVCHNSSGLVPVHILNPHDEEVIIKEGM